MTDLYRYYDAQGALLYVGIADDWRQRMKQHRYADWFPMAGRLSVEYHPDRRSAAAAELAAIRSEWPLYNVHASPWKTGQWFAWLRWRRLCESGGRVFGNGRKVAGAALAGHERKRHREIREQTERESRLVRTCEYRLAALLRPEASER